MKVIIDIFFLFFFLNKIKLPIKLGQKNNISSHYNKYYKKMSNK